jgi:hypothetical protein
VCTTCGIIGILYAELIDSDSCEEYLEAHVIMLVDVVHVQLLNISNDQFTCTAKFSCDKQGKDKLIAVDALLFDLVQEH